MRESSGFIGKDVDLINEAAFFYHRDQNKPEFYNFLIEIWKSQSIGFIYESYTKLKTLSDPLWDAYKIDKSIPEKIIKLKEDSKEFNNSLSQLNYYYNVLNIKREVNDSIKFGDVFVNVDQKGTALGDFFLCITAHCDCVQPENIYNNFYFVRGKIHASLEQALVEGDTGFNSFLKGFNNENIVIQWHPKPVIIPMSDNCIIGKDFQISIGASSYNLKYLATLKENYCQRMANNAFSHAMRVGILFADKKTE
jgi:hypothetical protein